MGFLKGSPPVCSAGQKCSEVARVYMKNCLCSVRDRASLTLGMVSILSWAVADIPQIISTFQAKSSEGLSLAFLATWIIGDVFNLVGCLLEPATLPTQFYMALFYSVTTLILTAQTIYYRYIYPRKVGNLHMQKIVQPNQNHTTEYGKETERKVDNDQHVSSTVEVASPLRSSPIPVMSTPMSSDQSPGRDFYIMSARSLSKSHTPPSRSYILHSRDVERSQSASIPEQDSVEKPLLRGFGTTHPEPPSDTKNLFCVVTGLTLFLVSLKCSLQDNNYHAVSRKAGKGIVLSIGRKLLQVTVGSVGQEDSRNYPIGSYFGWAMAIIYMGGRLPQICLNIRRGHVEGLNPFMFLFALIGNLAYVASILVKSFEWAKIQLNLPWLVDAGGCIVLDTFSGILIGTSEAYLTSFVHTDPVHFLREPKNKFVSKCDPKLTNPAH